LFPCSFNFAAKTLIAIKTRVHKGKRRIFKKDL
jgi:hypothetical protein